LSSGITPRLTSHLRAQFSQDREQLFPNTTGTQGDIYDWMEDLANLDFAAADAGTGCIWRRP